MAVVGLILVCAISCLVLLFLLRLAAENVAETLKETEEPVVELRPKPWYLVLSCAVIVASGLFLYFAQGETVLSTADCLLLLAILWACAWSDVKAFIIPNRIVLIGLILRCVLIAAEGLADPGELRYILLRSVIAAGALFVASMFCRLVSPKAIGAGDIKLLVLMGLFLTTYRIWGAMLLSMIAAFVYSLYLVLVKKANRQTEIPFAPLLLTGTVLSIFLTSV